jgi:hypothetical protein
MDYVIDMSRHEARQTLAREFGPPTSSPNAVMRVSPASRTSPTESVATRREQLYVAATHGQEAFSAKAILVLGDEGSAPGPGPGRGQFCLA